MNSRSKQIKELRLTEARKALEAKAQARQVQKAEVVETKVISLGVGEKAPVNKRAIALENLKEAKKAWDWPEKKQAVLEGARSGGRKTSEAKAAAARANLEKARAARKLNPSASPHSSPMA